MVYSCFSFTENVYFKRKSRVKKLVNMQFTVTKTERKSVTVEKTNYESVRANKYTQTNDKA